MKIVTDKNGYSYLPDYEKIQDLCDFCKYVDACENRVEDVPFSIIIMGCDKFKEKK